jgi:HSP20 family molecular chaperone IbpA
MFLAADPRFNNMIAHTRPMFYVMETKANDNSKDDNATVKAANVGVGENNTVTTKTDTVQYDLKYYVNELTDSYELEIEIPGVKLSDVKLNVVDDSVLHFFAERKSSKGNTIMYNKHFTIDKTLVDVSAVHAELEDGVLSIKMTKKQPVAPVDVSVTKSEPTDENFHEKHSSLVSVDLPGVKVEDVEVKYHDGKILIVAKRMRPNKDVAKIMKSFRLDVQKFDETKLSSYLVDGVLTVFGQPRNEAIDSSKDSPNSKKDEGEERWIEIHASNRKSD